MRIAVVDDDATVLTTVATLLTHLRHEVWPYRDPIQAVAGLAPVLDLVISDIGMPEMDGFGVAEHVARAMGASPPRTVLMSGADYGDRLAFYPASLVMGILPKPVTRAALQMILDMGERSRTRCPGTFGPFCGEPAATRRDARLPGLYPHLCQTPDYATCPLYERVCGPRLRAWIAAPTPLPGAPARA